jgi:hypothetical protein
METTAEGPEVRRHWLGSHIGDELVIIFLPKVTRSPRGSLHPWFSFNFCFMTISGNISSWLIPPVRNNQQPLFPFTSLIYPKL